MKVKKKFVLSSKGFDYIAEAENTALGMFQSGCLKKGTTLYEVKKVYDLKIRFEERKK